MILATLQVDTPAPGDAFIAAHADAERLAWMHANFTDHAQVEELGGADSYATRLYDYGHTGHDQLQRVVDRLRRDPCSRCATVTTFEPLSDTTYIPCVSMLDFWLDAGELQLAVYAHSIDFGTKGYGNLVELASIQLDVARRLAAPVGSLSMIVKSAHIYDTELDYVHTLLSVGREERT